MTPTIPDEAVEAALAAFDDTYEAEYLYGGTTDNKEAAMRAALTAAAPMMESEWKRTVMDIFDDLHFKPGNMFDGGPAAELSNRLIKQIEDRHHDWFCAPAGPVAETREGGRG